MSAREQAQKTVYNIPAGYNFAKSLAQYLLQREAGQNEALSRYKILLPTRRACRTLRETFLALNAGKPMLLPQMSPIGDVEEEELSLGVFGRSGLLPDIPPAISPLRRQFLLARLIRKLPGYAQNPDHALGLAQELGRFMDQVIIEGLSLKDLHKLVPEEFSRHWQITIDFMVILSEWWPGILQENGVVDSVTRRNLLLRTLARHWRENPPEFPIIAAGSTGSIPATAELLDTIAGLNQGAVILPGLDTGMDAVSWDVIGETHPQHGLKNLLQHMDVVRERVVPLPELERQPGRARFASEIMRPAETSSAWKDVALDKEALEGIGYYCAETQQDEAQIIALALRETLETPGFTAALVTPDRGLGRRVAALCRRWAIEIDDSGGSTLAATSLGRFIILTAEMCLKGFDPVRLLSVLKHPLCRVGIDDADYEKLVLRLELDGLRQEIAPQTFSALVKFMEGNSACGEALRRISDSCDPLMRVADGSHDFMDILKVHLTVLEVLAGTLRQSGGDILWRGEDGEAASSFFTELQDHAYLLGKVDAEDYQAILTHLLANVTVRPAYGNHPRLQILGQLEARLSGADFIVLGGLNEGIWPAGAQHDPWMSRPMRAEFGLPAPDRSIGLAAHDFVQGFCAANVLLTCAARVDNAPVSPARWVQRLDTVLQAGGLSLEDLRPTRYVAWSAWLDHSEYFKPCKRPEPAPPFHARPKKVSITRISTWLSDPYSIYARYVLGLKKIDPLRQDLDAALRGKILHHILQQFLERCPEELPENAADIFMGCAQEVLAVRLQNPEDYSFAMPRLRRIQEWFIGHEKEWRQRARFLRSEVWGEVKIPVDGHEFTIHGRADRLDRLGQGYAVIDYKTGYGDLTQKAFKAGELPQLPLEALMLAQGGFGGVDARAAHYLGYWTMTGGNKQGEILPMEENIAGVVDVVLGGLTRLLRAYSDETAPFYAIPDPANKPRFNDYEHLERVREWAALDASETGEVV